jgi:hypothetical protein
LKADTVVLATGSRSEKNLGEHLSGFISNVFSAGDCVEPRDVMAAIGEESSIGKKI